MRPARILHLLGCGLFFLCFLLSLHAAGELEGLPDLRTLRLDGASIDGKAARAMLEREQEEDQPVSFAVWAQQSGGSVENRDLGRAASPDVLTLCGSSVLLLPSSAPLLPEDREGCLLDRTTAQNLFGTSEPVGSVLQYGDRTLTVRGVVDGDAPLLMVQALPEGEAALDRVTLRMPAGASAQKLLNEFGNRHALSGMWLAQQAWAFMARFFSLLAPLCLLGSVLCALLRTTFSLTEYPLPFLLCLAAAGAAWFLLLWLTGFSFQFPEEFIPTKWSDFSFWSRLWEEKKTELLLLLTSEKQAPELPSLLAALRAAGFGLAAAALFPFTLARLRPRSLTHLWLLAAGFLLLAFWGAVALGGGVLLRSRLLWLCPGAYLCASYCARRLRQWSVSLKAGESPPAGNKTRRFRVRSGKAAKKAFPRHVS